MMPTGQTPPEVSVVIPVHDEVEALPELHTRLSDALEAEGCSCELLFVDDASTDGSGELLRKLARGHATVGLIVLAHRCGQLGATLIGMAHSRAERVVTIDADLEHPPEAVPRLLAALTADRDVVVALRRGEGAPGLSSRLGRWLARWVFGVKLPKDLSTFRVFRGECARELGAIAPRVVLLGAELSRSGLRIGYVPIRMARRELGESKYTLRVKAGLGLRAAAVYGCRPWRLVLKPCFGEPQEQDCPVREIIPVDEVSDG